jgi:DNA-binding MarR family transcriptional regulator
MNYSLLKDLIDQVEKFSDQMNNEHKYSDDIAGFSRWMADNAGGTGGEVEPEWEGKGKGRTAESVINTLIVHMNRYAKTYSKAAIWGSKFSTQDDFIFLITLKAFGPMTKMELIKKNIQEKPVGNQIINRLIDLGWVEQRDSSTDKRSKIIQISKSGLKALEKQMDKIREATKIVTGNLTHSEKMELIRLLKKLDDFHHPIYTENLDSSELLNHVSTAYLRDNN